MERNVDSAIVTRAFADTAMHESSVEMDIDVESSRPVDEVVPTGTDDRNLTNQVDANLLLSSLEDVQCYCTRKLSYHYSPPIRCVLCNRKYHASCIQSLDAFGTLFGDNFFIYTCKRCFVEKSRENDEKDQDSKSEFLSRQKLRIIQILHIAIYHLSHSQHKKFFHYKQDICTFIYENWYKFSAKSTSLDALYSKVLNCLKSHSPEIFISSKQVSFVGGDEGTSGYWALTDVQTYPFQFYPEGFNSEKPLAPIANGKMDIDFALMNQGTVRSSSEESLKSGTDSVASVGDHYKSVLECKKPVKKSKKASNLTKVPERPSIKLFLDVENPIDTHVTISRLPTHKAPQIKLNENGRIVSNDKGYSMCKSSHGVTEGTWYFECKILSLDGNNYHPNARIGWAQISADLQTPCGFDEFGYAYRGRPAAKFHNGYGIKYGLDLNEGDILGVLIHLPKQEALTSIEGEKCDPLPDCWDMKSAYETKTYYLPRPICHGSWIRFFVNGEDQGIAFENLYYGKYHPAISCYMGGRVEVCFKENQFANPQKTLESIRIFNGKPLADLIPSRFDDFKEDSNN